MVDRVLNTPLNYFVEHISSNMSNVFQRMNFSEKEVSLLGYNISQRSTSLSIHLLEMFMKEVHWLKVLKAFVII